MWGAGLLALALAAPNLAYQATNGWPQLDMGRALARHNATEVRLLALPILLVMLGLPLVPVWVAGLVALWRGRHGWGDVRFLAAALPVLLVLVVTGGSQFYYSLGLLTAVLAAGCVVVVRWWRDGRAAGPGGSPPAWRQRRTSGVIALPLIPVEHLGSTPVPLFNQIAQDQVGWEEYVADVARVRDALPVEDRARAVVVTDNYGEAGAIDRYGAAYGIDEVYSAQNELYLQGRPPEEATLAVVVGTRSASLRRIFSRLPGRRPPRPRAGRGQPGAGPAGSVCDLPRGGGRPSGPGCSTTTEARVRQGLVRLRGCARS